jgi:hypothetical protein
MLIEALSRGIPIFGIDPRLMSSSHPWLTAISFVAAFALFGFLVFEIIKRR